ncbi:MAG: SGNH/GDSL hydrolase family protein, partial [Kiritimatiellia bacterium]
MKPCFRRVALLAALVFSSTAFSSVGPFGESVVPRGAMTNARTIFERTGRGTVAFLGGSITEMNGYRSLVAADLKRRFPACAFTFISAGVSSTCSTTGAFRFEEDVLKKGTPDLLFFEFAVNDDQDAHHTRELAIRGMEGILRHACAANPKMDAVMVLFVNRGELTTIQRGVVPIPY